LDIDSASRDAIGNPIYGEPTSGAGWSLIYSGIKVRLAFSSKSLVFATTGERVTPAGIMYYDKSYTLKHMDRVVTSDGIEYYIKDIVPAYKLSKSIDHYEAHIDLP
jgi:hypothetical protein